MSEALKRTPLYPLYKTYGAKVIDFGGWELPVQFTGIKKEHDAVRKRAGLFDVSHMGEVEVKGEDALSYLQYLVTNDVSKLVDGQALYTPMCYPNGGTVDDLLIYKFADQHYLLVINAANIQKDLEWIQQHKEGNVTIKDVSDELSLLALQGPLAENVLQKLVDIDLSSLKVFSFDSNVHINGIPVMISRTGYTGEDGFEIYLENQYAQDAWKVILGAGEEEGVLPCGLGARDTLRFEARLPLYGQELTKDITPIEAGLGFFVKVDKGDFIGKEILAGQKQHGAPRKLVGLEMIERGIPRSHYLVYNESGKQIGEVTTGTQSPTLKKNIALALLEKAESTLEKEVYVEIRNKKLKARIVKLPFYKRKS